MAEALLPRGGVPPAAEPHGLDRNRGHSMLGGLDGEIVLVSGLVGPVAAMLVDADDVVDTPAMTRDADHRGQRTGGFRPEQIRKDRNTGPALECELLANIGRKFT